LHRPAVARRSGRGAARGDDRLQGATSFSPDQATPDGAHVPQALRPASGLQAASPLTRHAGADGGAPLAGRQAERGHPADEAGVAGGAALAAEVRRLAAVEGSVGGVGGAAAARHCGGSGEAAVGSAGSQPWGRVALGVPRAQPLRSHLAPMGLRTAGPLSTPRTLEQPSLARGPRQAASSCHRTDQTRRPRPVEAAPSPLAPSTRRAPAPTAHRRSASAATAALPVAAIAGWAAGRGGGRAVASLACAGDCRDFLGVGWPGACRAVQAPSVWPPKPDQSGNYLS
jgi:hypothetical protein